MSCDMWSSELFGAPLTVDMVVLSFARIKQYQACPIVLCQSLR